MVFLPPILLNLSVTLKKTHIFLFHCILFMLKSISSKWFKEPHRDKIGATLARYVNIMQKVHGSVVKQVWGDVGRTPRLNL